MQTHTNISSDMLLFSLTSTPKDIQLQHHRTYQTKLAQLCHTTSLKASHNTHTPIYCVAASHTLTKCHVPLPSLQVRVLGSLESYAAQRRLHRDNQRLAERCRAVCLLQQSWRLWLARCEDCEEMKLAPRSAIARQHFRCSSQHSANANVSI